MQIILLLLGFIFLIKGADFLVEGASSIARKWGVSPLVIGLTVVAFGTSMPELMVSLLSSINGSSDLAIGNVVGSNIANTLLILGVAAVIFPLKVTSGTVWKEIPLSLLAVLVLAVLANDALIDGASSSALTRIDGLAFLSFFLIFLYYTFGISKIKDSDEEDGIPTHKIYVALGMVLLGLTGLMIGGNWVVTSSSEIAKTLGLSEKLIGLTIVAIGTSLPELFTSAIAAYKHRADIAIGNVVGSNIFNVFFVLGTSSSIHSISYAPALNFDLMVAGIATAILFLFMFIGKSHSLDRWQGAIFILLYIAYLVFLVLRG